MNTESYSHIGDLQLHAYSAVNRLIFEIFFVQYKTRTFLFNILQSSRNCLFCSFAIGGHGEKFPELKFATFYQFMSPNNKNLTPSPLSLKIVH